MLASEIYVYTYIESLRINARYLIARRRYFSTVKEHPLHFSARNQPRPPPATRTRTTLNASVSLVVLQSLLTHVSRATKQTLNKLGVFTVSSFHAFICARSPSLLNNLLAGRGATKRRPPLLSRSNSGSSRRSLQISSRDEEKSVKVSVPENQVRSAHRVS